jgi:hypothetical protein
MRGVSLLLFIVKNGKQSKPKSAWLETGMERNLCWCEWTSGFGGFGILFTGLTSELALTGNIHLPANYQDCSGYNARFSAEILHFG